jgi:hypothetical protein
LPILTFVRWSGAKEAIHDRGKSFQQVIHKKDAGCILAGKSGRWAVCGQMNDTGLWPLQGALLTARRWMSFSNVLR